MTSNIRHALFKVLLLTTFTEEGNIVIDNGDQVRIAVYVYLWYTSVNLMVCKVNMILNFIYRNRYSCM